MIRIVDTLRSISRLSLPFSVASYVSCTVCDEMSVVWCTPFTRRFTISAMLTTLKMAAPIPEILMVSYFALPPSPLNRSMA